MQFDAKRMNCGAGQSDAVAAVAGLEILYFDDFFFQTFQS